MQLLGTLSQLLLDNLVDEASEWQRLITQLHELIIIYLVHFTRFFLVKCHKAQVRGNSGSKRYEVNLALIQMIVRLDGGYAAGTVTATTTKNRCHDHRAKSAVHMSQHHLMAVR